LTIQPNKQLASLPIDYSTSNPSNPHLSPLKRFKLFPSMADIQEGRFAMIHIKTGFY